MDPGHTHTGSAEQNCRSHEARPHDELSLGAHVTPNNTPCRAIRQAVTWGKRAEVGVAEWRAARRVDRSAPLHYPHVAADSACVCRQLRWALPRSPRG